MKITLDRGELTPLAYALRFAQEALQATDEETRDRAAREFASWFKDVDSGL